MKARVIVLFLLLVPIVPIFYSCCDCDSITVSCKYSHKALSLKLLDNSGAAVIESEALQLNKNAFGIRLYLTREGCEECGENTVSQNIKQLSTFFAQSAYAFICCDCPPDFAYLPLERIESIKIFTLNNFDSAHPEGSDITDYFRSAGGSFQKVENLVSSLYYDWAMQLPSDLTIDLLLMVAPTTDNKQQFKIEVALSDGRILEQQTPEIELL